jgi:hypothetical protein
MDDSKEFGLFQKQISRVIGSQGVRGRTLDLDKTLEKLRMRAGDPDKWIEEEVSDEDKKKQPDLRQVTKRQSLSNLNASRLARRACVQR